MKTNKKAISLIVLVITIIVLAILASTVIISLSNTNIIEEANDAVFKSNISNYKHAYDLYLADKLMDNANFDVTSIDIDQNHADFNKIFGDTISEEDKASLKIVDGVFAYETNDVKKNEVLAQMGLTTWRKVRNADGDITGFTNGTKTINIGTTINYISGVSEYNGTWGVIGVEGGKLKLVSTKSIGDKTLSGPQGYMNGVSELNAMCKPYGNGKGANLARALTANDLNEIFDFEPGDEVLIGQDCEYNNVATYIIQNGKLLFSATNGKTGSGANNNPEIKGLTKLDGTDLAEGVPYVVTNNYYSSNDISSQTMFINDNIKNVFFSETTKCWLATEITLTRTFSVSWGLMNSWVKDGTFFWGRKTYLHNSGVKYGKTDNTHTFGVRAVVLLDANVQFDSSYNII